MTYLILSLLVLAVAPAIAKLFRHHSHFEDGLAGFLLVVLGGVIFAELLPLSFQYASYWVIPVMFLGLIGPTLIEKLFQHAADSTHQITLAIGFSGLLLHTMVDGASLNEFKSIDSASPYMPLAIILHRIPVALSVLWIVRPVYGLKGVSLALAGLGIFTLFGYILGVQMETAMNTFSFSLLQAFVSGALLHVLLHRPHKHHHEHGADSHHKHNHGYNLLAPFKAWGRYQTVGCVIGVITLVFLEHIHSF